MTKKKDVVRVDWQQFSQEEQESFKRLAEKEKNYRPFIAWSQSEIARLKRFYGKVPAKMLASELKRTASSIHQKAQLLGIGGSNTTNKKVREK